MLRTYLHQHKGFTPTVKVTVAQHLPCSCIQTLRVYTPDQSTLTSSTAHPKLVVWGQTRVVRLAVVKIEVRHYNGGVVHVDLHIHVVGLQIELQGVVTLQSMPLHKVTPASEQQTWPPNT